MQNRGCGGRFQPGFEIDSSGNRRRLEIAAVRLPRIRCVSGLEGRSILTVGSAELRYRRNSLEGRKIQPRIVMAVGQAAELCEAALGELPI